MTWGETLGKKKEARSPAPAAPVLVTGGSKYGRKALDDECRNVAEAQEGQRNDTLNRAAFAAGQLVAGGELAESEAEAALTQAAKQCGLSDFEIGATIGSGMRGGKREPRSAPPREEQRANRSHLKAVPTDLDSWIDGMADEEEVCPIGQSENLTNWSNEPQGDGETEPEPKAPDTIETVLEQWRADGALIHESTGIPKLDELTGGGPVYGSRWYFAGAPDAGKTALLIQLGHVWAERGVTVGFLAVDEEPSDLVARFAQRKGWRRHDTETRDNGTLDAMGHALGGLPVRFYDASWTIESAAQDLAKAANGGRAALLIDSVQTVQCEVERLAEREMAEVQAVTARTRAIRACASHYRLIAVATSELGRSAYSSDEARRSVSTLAAGKWSGAIEYSARVLIGVRSVADETDLVDLELAKNKHGPRDEHVYLRIDRASQSMWQADYEPEPEEDREARRDEKVQRRVREDAARVVRIIRDHHGITARKLWTLAQAEHGISRNRAIVAIDALGEAVVRGEGPNNSTPLTLDESRLPEWMR